MINKKVQIIVLTLFTFIAIILFLIVYNNEQKLDFRSITDILNEVGPTVDTRALNIANVEGLELNNGEEIFKNNNIQLVNFALVDEDPEIVAGGCILGNKVPILIINNSMYNYDINNLLNIIMPENEVEFLEVVNSYFEYNHSLYCGEYVVPSISKSFSYQNSDFGECSAQINIRVEDNILRENVVFYFGVLSEVQPISLDRYVMKGRMVAGDYVDFNIERLDTVEICQDGYIY